MKTSSRFHRIIAFAFAAVFAAAAAWAEDIPRLAANLHLNGKTLGAFRPLAEADVREILKLAAK